MLNKIPPCILKHKTIIPSISIYYAKYHNINLKNHIKKLLMLTNSIVLAINECNTLKPLASSLGPSQIVCVTLTTINGAVAQSKH